MRSLTVAFICLGLAALSGCGGPPLPVARVSGKVTCKGQPVSGGSITFSPVGDGKSNNSGKAATGKLNDNGEFTLSTYGTNDGAVVGKHRVALSIDDPTKVLKCSTPTDWTVEVSSSGNQFNFELEDLGKKK